MGYVLFFVMLISAILLIPFNDAAVRGAAEGLKTAAISIIPSLFPFVAVSSYLLRSPVLKAALTKCRFASSIILPVICCLFGIPSSAIIMNELCLSGSFGKKYASILCALYTLPGPLYIISALSVSLLNNKRFAPFFVSACYAPSIVASIVTIFINNKRSRPVFSEALHSENRSVYGITEAISSASDTMLRITGTIVFFSVIFEVLDSVGIFGIVPGEWSGLIKGSIEMTNGLKALSSVPSRLSAAMSAALLSFGGIAVYIQSKMIYADLSGKLYFATKLSLAAASGLIMWIIFPLIPNVAETLNGLSESLGDVSSRFGKRTFYFISISAPFVLTLVISLVTTFFLKKEKGRR